MNTELSTVSKAWVVSRQFHKEFFRFNNENAARIFADRLAREACGRYSIEIFTCTSNLRADIPVVEVR